MRRPLFVLLAIGLTSFLSLRGAGAITPAGFDCGPDDGRERLTADGFHLDFQAPQTTATGHDVVGLVGGPYPQTLMERATAHFHFRVFPAPATSADLRIAVDWEGQGDFDLDVYDGNGNELGSSHEFNPESGNGESAIVEDLAHCTDIQVHITNYLASPEETVSLDIDVTPGETLFACEEEDPHPACAGKLVGEAPDVAPDTRTRLYLGGDRPGQLAMVPHYPYATAGAGDPPMQGRLVSERPTGGAPNTFTHYALGNTNQAKNPFQAHFTLPVEPGTRITGDLTAVLWLSSQTLQDGGTLNVDLFADSTGALAQTLVGHIAVPGEQVGTDPTPLVVTFQDVDLTLEYDLTLQISSLGVVTTGGSAGNPADAQWTLYYDSVQFPSHVTLDLPQDAPAA